MAVTVRRLDLEREEPIVLGLLERNLAVAPDLPRFDWLYRRNPSGAAWAWGACDEETGRAIGSASVFPRDLWIDGRVVRCGQVGHFSVDAGHRTLGPALMLQRATFEPVALGLVALCYDCPPHDRGMATFRRLGMRESCELRRHARVVRADRYVARALGTGRAARGLAAVGNLLLRARPATRPSRGVEIARHEGRFDEEFSALDRQVGGRLGIRGERTAEQLNWRFRDDPSHRYEVFTARRGGALLAFVAVLVAGEDARVVDLFGAADGAVEAALLEAAVNHARRRGAETVHAMVSAGHRSAEALGRAGFSVREAAIRVVAYALPGSALGEMIQHSGHWSFGYAEYMG